MDYNEGIDDYRDLMGDLLPYEARQIAHDEYEQDYYGLMFLDEHDTYTWDDADDGWCHNCQQRYHLGVCDFTYEQYEHLPVRASNRLAAALSVPGQPTIRDHWREPRTHHHNAKKRR